MREKKAREIMKPFEMYKAFPFAWLDKDKYGNPSAMALAEAKGYLEAIEKADRMLEKVADGIYQDDHIALSDALAKWKKEK